MRGTSTGSGSLLRVVAGVAGLSIIGLFIVRIVLRIVARIGFEMSEDCDDDLGWFDPEEDDLFVFICGCIFHRDTPTLMLYPCSDGCEVVERTLDACENEDVPVWYGDEYWDW